MCPQEGPLQPTPPQTQPQKPTFNGHPTVLLFKLWGQESMNVLHNITDV